MYIYGTTPEFHDVRDWQRSTKASRSPTATSATPARCACLARRWSASCFRRVADRQGGARSKRLVQGHRRAEPQGRQHDGHRPGRHPAGARGRRSSTAWPASRRTTANQSTSSSTPAATGQPGSTTTQPNTLSDLYPVDRSADAPLHPAVGNAAGQHAAAGAVHEHRPDHGEGHQRSRRFRTRSSRSRAAARAAPHPARPAGRLQHPRHDRDDQGARPPRRR